MSQQPTIVKAETVQPAQPAQTIVVQQAPVVDPRLQMRGVAEGGYYTKENYCGPISLVIGLLLLPCICCCPVDQREVYIEPTTGRRVQL
jgi:hypothetical protein